MLCWTMDGWLFLIYYSSSFFSWASQHNLGPLLQGWEWTIVVEEEVPTLPKLIQTALNAGNSVRKRWHADPCHHNIWHMASCENCFIDVWTEARVLWLQRRAGFWEGGSKFLFPRHRVMKSKEFATFQRPKCHLIGYGAWFYITDAVIPKDASTHVEVVANVLSRLKALGVPLRDISFTVQCDNTVRECKNNVMLSFLASLVSRGCFGLGFGPASFVETVVHFCELVKLKWCGNIKTPRVRTVCHDII